MKKLLAALLLVGFSVPALAGVDDARLDLDLTGFSFLIAEGSMKTYDQIQLDIEQTPRVFKAAGALKYSADPADGFPVDGTCALTEMETVFCSLNFAYATLYLELDGELNGTYVLLDGVGASVLEGIVSFVSLQ